MKPDDNLAKRAWMAPQIKDLDGDADSIQMSQGGPLEDSLFLPTS
ncbi:hypothetical protein [Aurantiacibacter arachoides]|nr:hypothetical protein [Aurantiacibacter arachoides]GGD45699.1 hypothetical protein GCM10011411_01640 [Aurantiacibacter arachoides]